MYVCVCLAVSQSEVEDAIANGASCRESVTRACGAGADCGACHGMIRQMIEDRSDALGSSTAAGDSVGDAAQPSPLVRIRAA